MIRAFDGAVAVNMNSANHEPPGEVNQAMFADEIRLLSIERVTAAVVVKIWLVGKLPVSVCAPHT